ncbi:microfibril-associated glycoprotein 4 [Strongylocentrotus purpuratus]|uniref:Fibrinogen C-terminal domain-containing protein n=1 Tax=Strongylocentrotus purpuratus TaxID=7668 RepID=A0A7M7NZ08_STRPU|nr:microfibril-associated glycoprotein 4 [Strongylocentrotus purpuratus]
MIKLLVRKVTAHNVRLRRRSWNMGTDIAYLFGCAFLVVLMKDRIFCDATRTQGEGEPVGGEARGGGDGFRRGEPAPPYPQNPNPVPQQPAACAQTVQPAQQFLPSWLPVNNIHVGGASQTNCSALEELVAKVTRQNELSERILSELENIPKSQRAVCENHSMASKSLPRDCSEVLLSGATGSGRYIIYPQDNGDPFYAYCDTETDGGGWTVIQRREDGSVSFYREWNDYKHGFGNVNSEHWLGNDKIHRLSAQTYYVLRIELEDFQGDRKYAEYDYFRIGDEDTGYKLLLGTYQGDAEDSLSFHGNKKFYTLDRDTDQECAMNSKGAWWYGSCFESNLNGMYKGRPRPAGSQNIVWAGWKGYETALKKTQMKIRPASYHSSQPTGG